MTIEDYNLVIASKNKIIEKYSIINTIFEEYEIDGYDMLIDIIRKYKSHKCENIPIQNTPKYIESQNEIVEESKQESKFDDLDIEETKVYKINITDNINKLTSEITKLTKIIEDNNKKMEEMRIIHKKELEELKKEYENKPLKKEPLLPTSSNSEEIKNNDTKLITGDQILEKYPIYIFPNTLDENCKYAAGENCNEISYNYNIKNMVNNKKSSLELVYNYILECKRIISPTTRKYEIEKKIERCYYLYKTYGDNLKKVSFSIGRLSRLGKVKWELWLNEFDKIMKKIINSNSS